MYITHNPLTMTLRVFIRDDVYIYKDISLYHAGRLQLLRSTKGRFNYLKPWEDRMEKRKRRTVS